MNRVDWYTFLSDADWRLADTILENHWHRGLVSVLSDGLPEWDVCLMPDGSPYLYRWEVSGDNEQGNVFFHIQVASDPERPLHDHPWDNCSLILSGGYEELFNPKPYRAQVNGHRLLTKGDMLYRPATEAHRLILPEGVPYTMTRFVTGPKKRDWGFWYPDGWHHNKRHCRDRAGTSIHVQETSNV